MRVSSLLLSPKSAFVSLVALIDIALAQNHYPITGVKTGVNAQTGYRPPRRDILDLVQDGPQFSIFVQALNKMMATPEKELTSYFQIAGIHGLPYISWDNVNPAAGQGVINGYCTHGNTLFPTWHRPYLALVEQVIAGHAQTLAKTYPTSTRATYQKAADDVRLPFWDWAAAPQRFPDLLTWPTVKITTPTGVKNVTNPLFNYKFLSNPEPVEWFPAGDALASCPTTVRCPDQNYTSHDELVNRNFADDGIYLTQQVWAAFAKTKTYNEISTSSNPNFSTSFEGPHSTIHFFVGGNGHMSPAAYAAFDPVFWLHHANVDRYMAMWQAIYPSSWIQPALTDSGTWTITPNTIIDGNSPLTPFTSGDKKTPWTSNTVRSLKAFGYSYPDVQDWLPRTPAQLAANVTARVNKLYNPDGSLGSFPARSMRIKKRETKKEWSVAIAVPNKAVGEGFSVKISVGDKNVGKIYILTKPVQSMLALGGNPITTGQFTLASVLKGVDGESTEAVVNALKGSVKWTVERSSDGSVVPNEEVEGLKVVVIEEGVAAPLDDSEFPEYGEKIFHPEITA